MRVLAFTPIWPNRLEPQNAPYNVQQFKALATRCELTVIAAVPYFPGAGLTGLPPRAAALSTLGDRDRLHGIDTRYMRQFYVPKAGLGLAVPLCYGSLAHYRELARQADVLLATWAYPHGCASILLARSVGRPCVVKVHGSDVNVVAKRRSARLVLRRVLPMADAMIAMSRPLADDIAALGVERERIHWIANGVDRTVFAVRDRREARRELGLPEDARLILFVGAIERAKGIAELLDAFEQVRTAHPTSLLAIVGEGSARGLVEARQRAQTESIVAPGERPLHEVATWMQASDVLALPSYMEGTPNVVLEALACGRPVVASRVGGIPDVVRDERAGLLVAPRDVPSLASSLRAALERTWDPDSVSACAPWSWSESGQALHEVLRDVREASKPRSNVAERW